VPLFENFFAGPAIRNAKGQVAAAAMMGKGVGR
jgi:hypothetical protein